MIKDKKSKIHLNKSSSRVDRGNGYFYAPNFIKKNERIKIIEYLESLHPIFEQRFSKHHPPPIGDKERPLLRPVFWLGNWQFACLNYYHPPKGIENRCVHAPPYPESLNLAVKEIEKMTRHLFPASDIPKNWELNTCLINYYGNDYRSGKKIDCARVGDHKDFEPGPVASLSFGERAFFQFILGNNKLKDNVVYEKWLEDSSLFIFAGKMYKERCFHRVQRVENKTNHIFKTNTDRYETRRINLTFRYVPKEHIKNFWELPINDREDTIGYVTELAKNHPYFAEILTKI